MSTTITSKSNNPFYVEDNVPSSTPPPSYSADISAASAPNIIVYVAPAVAPVQEPIYLTITGSGKNPDIRLVSLGVNQTFSSLTNSITLTNLNVGTVYGGLIVSANPSKGTIASNPIPNMTAALTGDTSLTINGGRYGNVFGGGGGNGASVTGNTTVNYMGDRTTAIYGGGDTGSAVTGNTNVNINGNVSLVFGGGGINSIITGNTNIDYTGGRVAAIYGGGDTGSVVTNNTNIAIGDNGALGSAISSIYGGGVNSTVLGNTTVTFAAAAALLKFRGVVSGGGLGKKSIVDGSRNLVFDNYSGMFNGAIMNFSNITIGGTSTMTLSRSQDRSDAKSTYDFAITDATLNNNSAMLTWNAKSVLTNNNPVVVSITSVQLLANGGDVSLISSSNFRTANSFNPNDVQVLDQFGDTVSSFFYTINYTFDKKLGGNVSIDYLGNTFSISGLQVNEIDLTDNPENVTVRTSAVLMAGINTEGGNDVLTVMNGATIDAITDMGTGNDTLNIHAGGTVGNVQAEGTKLTVTGTVGGSVAMTAAAGDNELDLFGAVIGNGVEIAAVTGNSTVIVDVHSSITGGIVTGDGNNTLNVDGVVNGGIATGAGNDTLAIKGVVNGIINTGAGNDTLTVDASGTVSGVVDMGADVNAVNVSGTGTYVFTGIISTGGTALNISGTTAPGEDVIVQSGGFGSVGATTTVASNVEALTFNMINSTAAGTLNTATDGANVFDASSLTNGQTLIDGTNLAGWDILDSATVGGHGVKLDGNVALGVGESVTLVNNHAVNLDNWDTSGTASVSLTVGGDSGSLTWNAVNHDYEGAVGGHTWTLGDAGQTNLTLGITA